MATLVGLDSTLSAEELVSAARAFAIEEEENRHRIAALIQCLTTLWAPLKSLAPGTNVEGLAEDLDSCVIRFREQFPSTVEILTLIESLWASTAYIHRTRNVCNLIPVITSGEVIRSLAAVDCELRSNGQISATDIDVQNTKAFCMIFAGVHIVADQLSVNTTTKERAEFLMGPLLMLLLRSFIQ